MIQLKPKSNWKEVRRDQIGRWYQWGDLRVCVGDPEQEGHWHISISHPYRYPTWDEIYTARYDFCPTDIDMAIILPRKTEYVKHPSELFSRSPASGVRDAERTDLMTSPFAALALELWPELCADCGLPAANHHPDWKHKFCDLNAENRRKAEEWMLDFARASYGMGSDPHVSFERYCELVAREAEKRRRIRKRPSKRGQGAAFRRKVQR